MAHEAYMKTALTLASNGTGKVAPNPLVGAVVVHNGEVIGQGWHDRYGEAHAEPNAIANCARSPVGATMYVTLEPCAHQGKQPPCVDAIIASGIKEVVIGAHDPNPLVAGSGVQALRDAGIAVTTGVLEEACTQLNAIFFHYIQTQQPYVLMKYAMTMDGKIATATGASKWITGEAARHHVHQLRHAYAAIMVGVETVIADNPSLTCRLPGGINPVRVICDTHLRTPLSAEVVQSAHQTPTWIATCSTDHAAKQAYMAHGCKVLELPKRQARVDLVALMAALGNEGISSVLLEGGSTLNWAVLEHGLVQRVCAYIAPKLIGGQGAKSPVGGEGVRLPDLGASLRMHSITQLGNDLLIESEITRQCKPE